MNDCELLAQYAENRSDAAFRQLLEEHIHHVYWTCRRELEDANLADDATVAVFVVLARKASALTGHPSIPAWLTRTSVHVSRNMRRSEEARMRSERRAAALQRRAAERREPDGEPLLTEALETLSPTDRKALMLRYADDLSMIEVAGELGTTPDTARKRVSRALARLRLHFAPVSSIAGAAS